MPDVLFTAVVLLQHAEQPLGSHRGVAGAGEEPAVRAGAATLLASAIIVAVTSLLTPACAGRPPAAERPSILWITAEDMSATIGAYGDPYATTPHLDRLASQSVRYTRAYAHAPVCSTARVTLITGVHAPTLGTHQMRSVFPLPAFMTGFPARLREAGYYTSNNVKTDYNTGSEPDIVAASWDDSSASAHWRNRAGRDRPFFSVFNLMTSHQSRTMVWPYDQFVAEVQSRLDPDEVHDPASAPVPPYYPDTPLVRREIARYYDSVTAMDKEVGAILQQLDEDGLAGDTIVFFYSDHGSGMPRHKRLTLETGLHVPLLIRFPDRWKHLAPAGPGETIDRLVGFADFGPTVLSLAGIEIPEFMENRPFLGRHQGAPRQQLFHYRDRIDESRDLQRAVRDGQYLYVRTFMPHLGYDQPSAWPDQGEIPHELRRLADARTMTGPQWHFAAPRRPIEELYAYREDPLNLRSLIGSAEHRPALERMRQALDDQLREHRDLGFIPESEAWRLFAGTTPWEAVRSGRIDLEPLFDAAAQVGVADERDLLANLASDNPGVRYWGAMALAVRDDLSPGARQRLRESLQDPSMAARIESANALARHGEIAAALPVLISALEDASLDVTLHAARTIELIGPAAGDAVPAMRRAVARAERIRPPGLVDAVAGDQDLAWFISMSAKAFLANVDARSASR
jgi:N-sulfoglucosamine sulfohydrolase